MAPSWVDEIMGNGRHSGSMRSSSNKWLTIPQLGNHTVAAGSSEIL